MALFDNKDPSSEIMQLRSQGLTDNLIVDELKKKGYGHTKPKKKTVKKRK